MFVTFVAYLSIIHFVDTFEKFKKMMAAWIWIHLFLGISGILMGGRGIGGFMGDENDFALVLNMAIPFAFFMGMAAKTIREKVKLFFTTGVLVLCVTATFSRGGFLGLVSVAGFCWLKSPRKILSLVLAILLLCAVAALVPEKYWDERIGSIVGEASNESGTAGQRLYTWGIGWEMFLDHPIFGVGPGNFPWNVQGYEPPEAHKGQSFAGRAAHSLYFTLLPELGMAGVIIFLLMLKASWQDRRVISRLVKRFFHLHRNAKLTTDIRQKADDYELAKYFNLAISASVVAYLVTGTFISVLYYPSLWLLIAFGIALKNVVVKMDETVPALVSGREGIGWYSIGRVFPKRIRGVGEN
jgi:Na+-transporting methylmalonyl-CoA/oxaloacetate decarboxylase gamma subunit